jgi:hypothetical protein
MVMRVYLSVCVCVCVDGDASIFECVYVCMCVYVCVRALKKECAD